MNSTRFGSIMMKRTSAGVARMRIDMIIALIDTDLPSGRASDKQMRHFREIGDDAMAFDVLADGDLQKVPPCFREHIREQDGLTSLVGHLDADVVRTGIGAKNTNAGRGESQSDVVVERHDAAHANARRQIDLCKSVTVGPATQPTTSAMMVKSSSVSCNRAAVSGELVVGNAALSQR